MHQNNSQLYSRKEIKTLLLRLKKKWLDLELPNFFFPLKYHLTTLERQLNYLKCFATMSLWPSNDLNTMLCHQSFLVQCLLWTYWKLLAFLESIQLKRCVKSAAHYFYCFNGFKSVTIVICQMGMWLNIVYTCCYSSLSINHVGCPIMTINFTIR